MNVVLTNPKSGECRSFMRLQVYPGGRQTGPSTNQSKVQLGRTQLGLAVHDGGLEAGTVIHELAHGLSTQLFG